MTALYKADVVLNHVLNAVADQHPDCQFFQLPQGALPIATFHDGEVEHVSETLVQVMETESLSEMATSLANEILEKFEYVLVDDAVSPAYGLTLFHRGIFIIEGVPGFKPRYGIAGGFIDNEAV